MRPVHVLLALALVALPGCPSGSTEQQGAAPSTAPGPNLAPNTSPAPLPMASKAEWIPPTISVTELHERVQGGAKLRILDVRSQSAFERERIKDAESLPWADIDARHAKLPRTEPLVLYCA